MSDEPIDGLVSEPAAEEVTLDSLLTTNIEQAIETPETEAEARARDEQGRFAKKTEGEASQEPADPSKPAEVTEAAPDPALQPVEAPARWTAEQKAEFSKWPPETQKVVADRYKAMEADYTRKTQETADFKRSAEPLLQAVQPHADYLTQISQQLGATPPQLIGQLIATERTLRTGTVEQRVTALAQVAASYGIDLAAMSRGEVSAPNPLILQQQQEISQLRQWRDSFEQQRQQELQTQTNQTIESFSNTKNTDGSPKYPHFNAVRGVMSQYLGSGEATTLEAAYEKATAPITEAVAKELSSRQQTSDVARQEALKKAQNVKPVRSAGTSPRGNAQASSLDDILSQSIAAGGIV